MRFRKRGDARGVIPVVGYFCGNEIDSMVAHFARPGGNVTGVSCMSAELGGKRVELLRETMPGLGRLGFLYSPAPGKDKELRDTREAATRIGISIVPIPVSAVESLPAALDAVGREIEAIVVSEDLFTFGNRVLLMTLASERRLPTMSSYREFVLAGGLVSYGASWRERVRRQANLVGLILKGAAPGDLPVEFPTKFELVINVKTARALGLAIPPSLLARADEVIE